MRSIRLQFLLATSVLAILFCAVVIAQTYVSTSRTMEEAMKQRTDLALEFDLAIRDYVASVVRPEMQSRIEPGEFIPETMSTSYVARSIFEKVREKYPDYLLKFSSENPRNPRNLAGPSESEVLKYFRENPDATVWRGRIDIDGTDYVACFKPRRVTESCLECHGDPADAPKSLRDRYGDEAGFHDKLGDVLAVDTVAMPMRQVTAGIATSFRSQLLPMLIWLGLFVGAIFIVFHWRIARPLHTMTDHIASQADETQGRGSFAPIAIDRRDEIGALADGYNHLVARFQTLHDSLEQRVASRTAQLRSEIDERENIEEELRRSRGLLEAILDTVPMGIAIVDSKKRVRQVNRCGLEQMGFDDAREVIGTQCYETICTAECDACPILDLNHSVDSKQTKLRKKDGGTIPILKTVCTTVLDGEKVLLEAFIDISDYKRAEQELKEANQQLVITARQAGMADIATGVLHNVGNALNSMNVSSSMIKHHLMDLDVAHLARAVDMLDAHRGQLVDFLTNDEKGKQLPDFLVKLSKHLQIKHAQVLEELDDLNKNIGHIGTIIRTQQSYANLVGTVERVSPTEVIEDALRMQATALESADVRIIRRFETTAPIQVDKQKLLAVLVNLIANARDALVEGGNQNRCLTLFVGTADNDRVQIRVADNGIGISTMDLTRIFFFGFTTKEHGHGFGLHTSANAMAEMGGRLQARSEGLGCGATFTVELPSEPDKKTAPDNTIVSAGADI